MALFFDQEWFDAKLLQRGLNRAALAAVLGVSLADLDDMWKDQREITPREVMLLAELLGVSAEEIAERGGVATPVPAVSTDLSRLMTRLEAIEARLDAMEARLESSLAEIRAKLDL